MLKKVLLKSKKWLPHKYQQRAVKFLLTHPAAGLFLDPGLGKTSIVLAALAKLKKEGQLGKVLLIAPLRVCHSVWPNEIAKWDDFKHLTYTVLHGKDKEKNLELDVDIYIINPEGLDWLLGAIKNKVGNNRTRVDIDFRRWRKLGFTRLVIDELTKFKHTNTNRFKMLRHILPTFHSRWGLTGSPAPNGLLDLFGQMFVIDLGQALGQYITKYRVMYFDQLDFMGYQWGPKPGAEQAIARRIAPSVLRMSADDFLELPARVNNSIVVDLPDKARKVYDQLHDDLIAAIESNVVVAATAAVASMKCRQVANGGIFLDPQIVPMVGAVSTDRKVAELHTQKVEAVEELLEELQGSPLLCAYEFQHDLARLQKHFGDKTPYIGSGVAAKHTNNIIARWNSGDIPLLLIQPQAGAHGLDGLQHAGQHICFHSMIWDFELYDQLIKRILRQGNKAKQVFVHHIVARGTIDEVILNTMTAKNATQQMLFNNLKKLRAA